MLVDALDVERARDLRIRRPGNIAGLLLVPPDDGLQRLVLRPHQRERLFSTELTPPEPSDPIGIRVPERGLGRRRLRQRVEQLSQPECQPP